MWVSLGLVAFAVGLWRRSVVSRSGAFLAATAVLIGLLLSVAYVAIDRLTGSGIDASVLYHLQAGLEGAELSSFRILAAEAASGVVACLVVTFLVFRLVRNQTPPPHAALRVMAGLVLLAGAVGVHPATRDLVRLVASDWQSAGPAGPAPPGFVAVDRATFTGVPRNFVLLYLESVERSYLDETRFPGLMPNLTALEDEAVSFTDLTEVEEAGWTIAGMVASQCGLPLIGSGAGMDRFLPGATCLGDVLAGEGYALAYLGGANLDFAGKGTFYDSHGFALVEGRSQLEPRLADPDYVNGWGLYDDSLYPEALRRFEALAASDRPFGLVLLTLDTHHPFGFTSRSCADTPYGDGSNQFLNAVHCADRLAAGFIRTLRARPAFANTVLVVASDHMAMPNLAQDRLEAGPRRNLLMLFAPDLPPARKDKPGTTLDLGPTLLTLIGAPAPALGYGRDLLADAPTLRMQEPGLETLIESGRSYLAAMWSYPQVTEGMRVDVAAGEVVLGDRHLKTPVLFRLNADLAVTGIDFEAGDDLALIERVASQPIDQRFIWVDACKRTEVFAAAPARDGAALCVLAGSLASPDLRQIPVEDGSAIPAKDLAALFSRSPDDVAFRDVRLGDLAGRRQFATTNVIDYTPSNGLTGQLAVRSAGYLNGASWAMNPTQGEQVTLTRGLTLLGLMPDAAPVKLGHVDTCGYGGRQVDDVPLKAGFQAAIAAHKDQFGAFVIVAHNSVVCYEVDPGLEPLFADTGLTKWRDLWYEEPYVAVISGNGEVQEFTGPRQTALGVNLSDFIRPPRSLAQRKLDWLPRITNAGGNLQGRIATDAIAAQGTEGGSVRLVGIDLRWTSHNELACRAGRTGPDDGPETLIAPAPQPTAKAVEPAQADTSFNPCTPDMLADWMRGQAGLRVVLDLDDRGLDAYARIAAAYPDLRSRLVPQIHQPEEYGPVRDLGFDDVIWALDQYSGDDATVLAWLRKMDLLGLALPTERLRTGLARQARDATGVLSWALSVETEAEMHAALQAGAAEIITDDLAPPPVIRFEAMSSGFAAGDSFLRRLDGTRLLLTRGVNLAVLPARGDPALLASFDGCAAIDTGLSPDPAPFHQALTEAVAQHRSLAIIVHDSAFCDGATLDPLFAGTPLAMAPKIDFRQPYVGLIRSDGGVVEYAGPTGTRLREILTVEVPQ